MTDPRVLATWRENLRGTFVRSNGEDSVALQLKVWAIMSRSGSSSRKDAKPPRITENENRDRLLTFAPWRLGARISEGISYRQVTGRPERGGGA